MMITKARKFLAEVTSEMKKVSWLTKKELLESTYVVIVSTAILGFFIAGVDFGLSKFLNIIIR